MTGKQEDGDLLAQGNVNRGEYYLSHLAIDRLKSEQLKSTERNQAILAHIEALRAETKQIKADIAKRKISLNVRRSTLEAAKKDLLQKQATAIKPINKSITRIEHRWEALHTTSAESRVFLCREAASLYGLHQRRRKKGTTGRDTYMIGGVPIVDLRDINSMSFIVSSLL